MKKCRRDTNTSAGILLQSQPQSFQTAIRSSLRELGIDKLVMVQRVLEEIIKASFAPQESAKISSSQDVVNLLAAEMATLDQEHLRVLLLNNRNEVLNIQEIYVGNVNRSIVRSSEVFRPAVRDNAPGIIVVHNHPSGNPTPSPEDISITRDLVSAGELLSIQLLDHIVIGDGGRYVSMKEKDLGFGVATGKRKRVPSASRK